MFFSKPEISIEVLSNKDLLPFMKDMPIIQRGLYEVFSGFDFFKPDIVYNRLHNKRQKYSLDSLVSPFEVQAIQKDFDQEYDIHICAIKNKQIIGIHNFKWDNYLFWSYHHSILDIKKKYQNKGLGRRLVEVSRDLPELKHKILRFGNVKSFTAKRLVYETFKDTKEHAIIPLLSYGYQLPKELKYYEIG